MHVTHSNTPFDIFLSHQESTDADFLSACACVDDARIQWMDVTVRHRAELGQLFDERTETVEVFIFIAQETRS